MLRLGQEFAFLFKNNSKKVIQFMDTELNRSCFISIFVISSAPFLFACLHNCCILLLLLIVWSLPFVVSFFLLISS